jgi:hypothetical protein
MILVAAKVVLAYCKMFLIPIWDMEMMCIKHITSL